MLGFSPLGSASLGATSGALFSPATGTLTLSGFAPTYTNIPGVQYAIGRAELALTGLAPALAGSSEIVLGAGVLILTGEAPAMANNVTYAPGAGTLTLTSYAPEAIAWWAVRQTEETWTPVSPTSETWTPVAVTPENWTTQ